jgi:lysine-N-methylase
LPDGVAAIVARLASGRCIFHDPQGLCAIHRDLGEARLPVSCRHFPRLALNDARGTFISLTHY